MDIVEQLRTTEPDKNGSRPKWYINPDGTEAADEIERLRKALVEVSGYVSRSDWHYMSFETDATVNDAFAKQKEKNDETE